VLCMKVVKELMEILEKGTNTEALNEISAGAKGAEAEEMLKVQKKVEHFMIETDMWLTDVHALKEVCVTMEAVMAARCRAAMDEFKGKLQAFMLNPEDAREFRYKVYDANQKMFSDEIQTVARTYAQWESFRAMNLVIQSHGADPQLLQMTDSKLNGGKLSDTATLVNGRILMLY